jgi:hypothetical protein
LRALNRRDAAAATIRKPVTRGGSVMNRSDRATIPFRLLLICCVAVAAGLAACGGGGGDDDDGGPPGTIDVTLANQNTLTRTALVTVQGGLIVGSLGIAGGPSPSSRALGRALLAGVRGGAAARERGAAVIGPTRLDCDVSGSVTFSLDDRDNDQQPSVGDVLSASFSACSDFPGEVIDGSMGATYTQVVASPPTVGASVTVNDLSMSDGPRSVAADGAFAFTYRETSASAATLHIVVSGSLAMGVTTPVFSDTVTMRSGYTIDVSEDLAAAPPGGGTPGRSTTTVTGQVSSAAAGGTVQVDTMEPIVQYSDDDYPREGRIGVTGKTGSLQATVLSTTEVRIETDTNGDGQFDSTTTLPWTQLL